MYAYVLMSWVALVDRAATFTANSFRGAPFDNDVAEELSSEALYASGCPEVSSTPRLALPEGSVREDPELYRSVYMPDGRGEATDAVLSGAHPRKNAGLGDIKFLLYTRENSNKPEQHTINDTHKPTFRIFRPDKPTIVLIHGFGDSLEDSLMIPLLKKAFLEHDDCNVLAVDWGRHAAIPWYNMAAYSTKIVGKHLAYLLDHMATTQGLKAAHTHVVGFSLGAHVAGLAGQRLSSGRLHKITGLDPAVFLFDDLGPELRLDPTDADVVEVVHSSGGYLGFTKPLGHRDFYPNGGKWPQPGCIVDVISVCSHRRAYYYYAEALNSGNRFPAFHCASLKDFQQDKCEKEARAHLGDDKDHCLQNNCTQGSFYFVTNPTSPFAKQTKM